MPARASGARAMIEAAIDDGSSCAARYTSTRSGFGIFIFVISRGASPRFSTPVSAWR